MANQDSVRQAFDNIFSTSEELIVRGLGREVDELVDAIRETMQREVRAAMNEFFRSLAAQTGLYRDTPPYSKQMWRSLSANYVKIQKGGDDRFFIFAETRRRARRRRKNPEARYKPLPKRDVKNSLRNTLARLQDPQKYFGDVEVRIDDMTRMNRRGQPYLPHFEIPGSGGRTMPRNLKKGYLGISIEVVWFANIENLNLYDRGALERLLPSQNKLQTKLLNDAGHYRPLIGPYLKWYTDNKLAEAYQRGLKAAGVIE
ncbi:hypothetical protein [Cupriavidus sp. DL-D2]|uniref:hypothetical protein n=1 Tax=Cupriavidus sp. DL-D2 TaxID=3144974 RepID=UPI003214F7B4